MNYWGLTGLLLVQLEIRFGHGGELVRGGSCGSHSALFRMIRKERDNRTFERVEKEIWL